MKPIDYSFLAKFYDTESMKRVSREIAHRLGRILPSGKTLAIGFRADFLNFLDANKVHCALPADPEETAVFNDYVQRVASCSWNAILVVHYLEFFRKNDDFLWELFRILKSDGKLIVICMNKNRANALLRPDRIMKNIKLLPRDLISSLTASAFEINSISGVNEKFNFWPRSFSYNLNKYNEVFMRFFPLFSDVIIIDARKSALVSEAIVDLEEQYGAT
ncbi:MAG: hypothetical protein LBT63_02330 [Holosporaceae bacterium]|jgi:SAM-dependent methyltransferase|nr:hypothetical protein [Holosporaceae bacterium]